MGLTTAPLSLFVSFVSLDSLNRFTCVTRGSLLEERASASGGVDGVRVVVRVVT